MDKAEAKRILDEHLARYRNWSYAELIQLRDLHHKAKIKGPSGTNYNFELEVDWEKDPDGPVRVSASVNDGNVKDFTPVSDSFVKEVK